MSSFSSTTSTSRPTTPISEITDTTQLIQNSGNNLDTAKTNFFSGIGESFRNAFARYDNIPTPFEGMRSLSDKLYKTTGVDLSKPFSCFGPTVTDVLHAAEMFEKLLKNIGSGLESSWRSCFEGLPNCEQSVQRRLDKHNEEVQAISDIKDEVQAYLDNETKNHFEINFPKDGNKAYPDGKKPYKSRNDFLNAINNKGEIGSFMNKMIKQYELEDLDEFDTHNVLNRFRPNVGLSIYQG